ncbi:hypothetical protein BO94DRAFT_536477 [Aspergillus sclerotioniger CBS 115572]|uniref:Uncharacterized protein n=1 Tax=Aspergillus sclerotioniger CBS 115572 TaxID=1450535 RepID=A0A317WF00_9EURO|nr:hypothetical protein BO94DRAFT_536477 [Aspergillus sclerotioniger CBS 115572]PWY83802.1 hypothetical protein BO94DRAFT_536477 [Aspergillus sclerotioniger CBS 115572]
MWFLLSDFSTRKGGDIKLGIVIEHPYRPTSNLASEGNGLPADLALPPMGCFIERHHEHPKHGDIPVMTRVWNAFLERVVKKAQEKKPPTEEVRFDRVDQEVWTFDHELDEKCMKDIVAVPKVRKYMKSGRRSVYVITAVWITHTPLRKAVRPLPNVSGEASSGQTGSTAGAEGGGQSTNAGNDLYRRYKHQSGIVLGYRTHMIYMDGSDVKCVEPGGSSAEREQAIGCPDSLCLGR